MKHGLPAHGDSSVKVSQDGEFWMVFNLFARNCQRNLKKKVEEEAHNSSPWQYELLHIGGSNKGFSEMPKHRTDGS